MGYAAWSTIGQSIQAGVFGGALTEFTERVTEVAQEVVPAPRFEAWCECPQCERFACHWLRPLASLYVDTTLIRIEKLFDLGARTHSPESGFEVIRTCVDCGHEWGMA